MPDLVNPSVSKQPGNIIRLYSVYVNQIHKDDQSCERKLRSWLFEGFDQVKIYGSFRTIDLSHNDHDFVNFYSDYSPQLEHSDLRNQTYYDPNDLEKAKDNFILKKTYKIRESTLIVLRKSLYYASL